VGLPALDFLCIVKRPPQSATLAGLIKLAHLPDFHFHHHRGFQAGSADLRVLMLSAPTQGISGGRPRLAVSSLRVIKTKIFLHGRREFRDFLQPLKQYYFRGRYAHFPNLTSKDIRLWKARCRVN
jgi:hypothetical protein